MKLDDIKNPISTIAGVGPKAVKLFASLNIFTVSDLLKFYPKSYEDRTKRILLAAYKDFPKVHTIAKVINHEWFGYGKMRTLKITINDGSATAELIAFNRAFLEKTLPLDSIISVTGSFLVKYSSLQSTAFEATMISNNGNIEDFKNIPIPDSGVFPIYSLTEGLTQKNIRKIIASCINQYLRGIENELPKEIMEKNHLLSKTEAIKKVHMCKTLQESLDARRTLIYEELFNFQCTMAKRAFEHKGKIPDIALPNITTPVSSSSVDLSSLSTPQSKEEELSPRQEKLLSSLPYKLTKDQLLAIYAINKDIDSGYKERSKILSGTNISKAQTTSHTIKPPYTMARLLQGDVGSGKTMVALFACLRIVDWGGQCAFMAPTEILAKQHAETTAKLLEPLNVKTAFLTGNVKSVGRNQLLKELKAGSINILVGTHALFSRQTVYKDLELAIIDEQHRFGVIQRQAIIEKGRQIVSSNSNIFASPHLLMMSATPIPQTLALTAFGDLDVSVIKTMPQGRKPITTYLVQEGHETNAYEAVRKELLQGRQAYFVYPAIEDSTETESNIKSAEKAFENLSENIYPSFKCGLIHSKIPENEQSRILNDFRDGKIQILASTTVVEVGVDVPNATCMVIEQADRFGLSALHQLRGRVGRGSNQSFCFLIYRKNITENGIERMKVLKQNTDGFIIAEKDLKLRGPGEIVGTVQAGNLTLGIADLNRDGELLLLARRDAFTFMQHKIQDGECEKDAAF